MQHFSFDFGDPVFEIADWRFSLQIITYENVYGLDADRTRLDHTEDGCRIRADGLTWAGGQEKSAGHVEMRVVRNDDDTRLEVTIDAECPRTIRCTKLVVSGLAASSLLARGWAEETIPSEGVIYQYPGYVGHAGTTVQTPLVLLRSEGDGHYIAARSMDNQVRCKRFGVYRRGEDVRLELIHEEAADLQRRRVSVPTWTIERPEDPSRVIRDNADRLSDSFGVRSWEQRSDVPDWARDIALVASIHGMHWSGYIFNDYDQILESLRWIVERIDGLRVLAFLPGWEGRYYWQYGDYRPDLRLGGEEGFARLVAGAHDLGVHLMPMFGMNSANTGIENFEQWGEPARMRTAGGYVYQGNKPDWDTARAHDPAWQAILNPGAPTWRNRLIEQVSSVLNTYGLDRDAVFFDTSHWWTNDPVHRVYEGIRDLRDEMVSRYPEILFSGEGWYDALGALTPVSHSHVPERWANEAFGRFNRTFAHLSSGDPSRGSTGVHERGTRAFEIYQLERHRWPTVTIVDGTIERASDQVEAVIEQARKYIDRFL